MKRYFMGTWNIALFVKKIIGWYGGNEEKKKISVRGGSHGGVGTEEMSEKPKISVQLEVGSGVRREPGKEGFLRT